MTATRRPGAGRKPVPTPLKLLRGNPGHRPLNEDEPAPIAKPWVNKIVGHGKVAVSEVLFNPQNFRIHPKGQKDALRGAIAHVGYLQSVLINQQTGRLIDGHLRVLLADEAGETEIDAEFIDLTPDEERMALLTIDPIGSLAAIDKEQLDELLRDVSTDELDLQQFLVDFAHGQGLEYGAENGLPLAEDQSAQLTEQFQVLVTCRSEHEHAALLERLTGEGYSCRALVS